MNVPDRIWALRLGFAAFGVAAGTFAALWVGWRIMEFDLFSTGKAALAAAGGGLAITVGLGMIGAWRTLSQKPSRVLAGVIGRGTARMDETEVYSKTWRALRRNTIILIAAFLSVIP